MQTFLPYPNLTASAACLDNKRLGKQRVENLQILKAHTLPTYGWKNHPAVKMWTGHLFILLAYQREICAEWVKRGYKDTCLEKSQDVLQIAYAEMPTVLDFPPWFGNKDFHRAHRSNLVRKDPAYYGPIFPGVPDDLPYIWPKLGEQSS